MTVTPLRKIPRPAPWRAKTALAPALTTMSTGEAPATPLTVRFEVTLDGESRYRDAAEVLEALQRLADRLGSASVRVRSDFAGDPPASGGPEWSTMDDAEVTERPATDDTVWIRTGTRVVSAHGSEVEFTRVEYDLLLFFARHPRRVFTRPQLLQIVWGYSHAGERTVDVHIRRLRAKLGEVPLVTTVRGVGYRLADEADLRIVHR